MLLKKKSKHNDQTAMISLPAISQSVQLKMYQVKSRSKSAMTRLRSSFKKSLSNGIMIKVSLWIRQIQAKVVATCM